MLSRDAKIFLFDKPFSALDYNGQVKVKNKLVDFCQNDSLIVYNTHSTEFSSIATRKRELQLKEH